MDIMRLHKPYLTGKLKIKSNKMKKIIIGILMLWPVISLLAIVLLSEINEHYQYHWFCFTDSWGPDRLGSSMGAIIFGPFFITLLAISKNDKSEIK
jgi:hypothetical protein